MDEFNERAGLRPGWIYEVVVESMGGHATPMGARFEDGRVVLRAYKSSETGGLISADGRFVIHFPAGVEVFAKVLESKAFDRKDASASLEVEVKEARDDGDCIVYTSEIQDYQVFGEIKPVNRAEALVLEALIESTKPRPDEEKIRGLARVVRKVAPDYDYERLIGKILGRASQS